jgi:hypothetical protein
VGKTRPSKRRKLRYEIERNGRVGHINVWEKTQKFGTHFRFAGKAYRNSFATREAAEEYLDHEFSTVDSNRANSLALHPINHDVKTYHELEQLLREHANGATLREVVDYFLAHHEHKRFVQRSVSDCIASFLANEIANNVSPSHAKTLKKHLKQFQSSFGSRPIHKISAEQISNWLVSHRSKDGNPWGETTRRHVRGSLVSLSLYARDTLHALPDFGKTEFQNVKRPKPTEKGEVEIYTPAEISKLLATAIEHDLDLIPGIVFGCFQGLRPDEFHAENAKRKPLSWEAINWQDMTLQVRGRKVRSRGTRPFPFHKVSQAWLEPFRTLSGAIWRYTKAEVREISGPRNRGISDNDTSDQKTIYSGIQSPGCRACGFGKTSGGSGRRARDRHEPPLPVGAQRWAACAARERRAASRRRGARSGRAAQAAARKWPPQTGE